MEKAQSIPLWAPTWMTGNPEQVVNPRAGHALVIPVYGLAQGKEAKQFAGRLRVFLQVVERLIVIDNGPQPEGALAELLGNVTENVRLQLIRNDNRGGLAGALNTGIEAAIRAGASTITILDQDSLISPDHLSRLAADLPRDPLLPCLIGPCVWDLDRGTPHTPCPPSQMLTPTRLLLSSGTTFTAEHWPRLGLFPEHLFIDYLDHYWCFRARTKGFQLYLDGAALLFQHFGEPHPNRLCRRLGMQLYSPQRHYTSLRNLLWLVRQPEVPGDIRLKELSKMLFKPWFWLLFEPHKRRNLAAILAAMRGRSFDGI